MSGDAKQKRTQRTHFKNTVSSKSDKKYGWKFWYFNVLYPACTHKYKQIAVKSTAKYIDNKCN